MEERTIVLNGLSVTNHSCRNKCSNCRQRKIRCSRGMPNCQRCTSRNLPCHYPQRQARVSKQKDPALQTVDTAIIEKILDRLYQVEQSCATHARPTLSGFKTAIGSPYDTTTHSQNSPDSTEKTPMGANNPSSENSGLSHLAQFASFYTLDPSQAVVGVAELAQETTGSIDVASILSRAVNSLEGRLRPSTSDDLHAVTIENLKISPELAKTWIQNYFLYNSIEAFLSLVDKKLIELIPDLLLMKHVRLDASILVVYYAILWHGCFVSGKSSYRSPDKKYAKHLYLCCLHAISRWRKEATGTMTDLIAALYMTRTAAECFDTELGWEMHRVACKYAQALEMHSLDGSAKILRDPKLLDDDRRGMWELIQYDIFYRLIEDRPPSLSSSLSSWRVNLPWLSLDNPVKESAAVPTMTFLLSSRLAFIIASCLDLDEANLTQSEALEKIEPLCHQIEDLFNEWGVEDWLRSYRNDDIETWKLSDLALTGYTGIIFMLRKAGTLNNTSRKSISSDSDIPKSEYALKASRRILQIIYHMLHVANLPRPETLSYVLGLHRAHVAYAYLANNIISSGMTSTTSDDLNLLQDVAKCIELIAKEEHDFLPLMRACQFINYEVSKSVEGTENHEP